jgi:tRNA dimethylallyltransferase
LTFRDSGVQIVAIVGPTASGKSDLALDVARRFGAEIIGADSRQVYRRLDIGSAKPTPQQRAAVPHHLIDVAGPEESFDCARFRELALAAIDAIQSRGKRVLVVGGTGLYVKVLQRGLFAGPRRDEQLRARLAAEEEAEPGALHRRLLAVDPTAAARLQVRDRVRLTRALEVYELTGKPISVWQAEHRFQQGGLDMRVIALERPRPELYERIDRRCRAMVAGGLVDEVRGLLADGLDPNLPSLRSPGYAEIGDYVRGLCTLEEALARMSRATRRLAKRQLTWLRGHRPDEVVPPHGGAVAAAVEPLWEGARSRR